ncbi:MAG: type II toxin-antitoxin system YoeB family toxin [Rhodobacter sp.]|nr:type II toxin-antitoxin system YoeB family toxin [Rhodobacter sp.]
MFGKGNTSVKECRRHRFKGTGQPGPLQGGLSGFRSRRTCREHRLVSVVRRDAGKGETPDRSEGAVQAATPGPVPRAVQIAGSAGAPVPSAVFIFCLTGRVPGLCLA